jgi:hypothetical protein
MKRDSWRTHAGSVRCDGCYLRVDQDQDVDRVRIVDHGHPGKTLWLHPRCHALLLDAAPGLRTFVRRFRVTPLRYT